MALRPITAEDLRTLSWNAIPTAELHRVDWEGSTPETPTQEETERGVKADAGWWRIVAEMSCSLCGAFQAADSDPTNDKQVATTLTVGLFHNAGWRVDEGNRTVCGECAAKCEPGT